MESKATALTDAKYLLLSVGLSRHGISTCPWRLAGVGHLDRTVQVRDRPVEKVVVTRSVLIMDDELS